MGDYVYVDGVYYGKSNATKPTDINEAAFWWNIDNDDPSGHKLYQFDPFETHTWIPQD